MGRIFNSFITKRALNVGLLREPSFSLFFTQNFTPSYSIGTNFYK